MTDTENLIYLAGFIDGEGCLTANRTSYGKKPYRARLTVCNTNRDILEWAKSLYGGKVYSHRCRVGQTKGTFEWMVFCNQAVALIEKLMPYLKVKKAEAVVFMELKNAKNNADITKDIYARLSALKHLS